MPDGLKQMQVMPVRPSMPGSYERLFSHASIWRRRPEDRSAVLPYLAMSYLYKRSNRFWYPLIRYRLTGRVFL